MSEKEKLWGGRFQSPVDAGIHRYTAAFSFDRRLARHDLIGSMAHARMLLEQGVLERADAVAILEGLASLLSDLETRTLEVEGDDEDTHSWIERQLGERIGEAAGRLHTARSRNDQTATCLRLYVREALVEIGKRACVLQGELLERSRGHVETWLPGYTHLQRGQPVSLAHHLLAHFWALDADTERLRRAWDVAGTSPLGAAALAGSPHRIDPTRSARLLGMERTYPNSMLAVADRDYVLEAAFACSVLMLHLSRWATEVILWTGSEFGFAVLDDSVAKGSSIMPQKRNPEAAEILRAKTGRVVGDLMALHTVLKGLPLTYNSDLQEDKESLFDALDTAQASLQCASSILAGLGFRVERMSAALVGGFLTATDLADYLVRHGTPFRSAHHQSGLVVQLAENKGCDLWQLEVSEIRELCAAAEDDVLECLSPEGSVRAHSSFGGPAPERVAEQLESADVALRSSQEWIDRRGDPPIYAAFKSGALTAESLE